MAQSNGDDRECVFCELMGTDKVEAYASGVAMITPLNPVVEGHKLFIHSTHTDGAAHDPHITGVVFREAAFYAKSLNQDFNLIVNGGKDAGQTVFHLHVHYVPRRAGDGLLLPWDEERDRKQHELEAIDRVDEAIDALPVQHTVKFGSVLRWSDVTDVFKAERERLGK